MKKEIYYDAELLKRILCYSSAPHAIAVNEEMVDYLFQGFNEVTLFTIIGRNLGEIINTMSIEESVKNSGQKIIFLVRTSERYPLTASDLSQISTLAGQFPKEADICWGMTTAKEVNNMTLLIAISSK